MIDGFIQINWIKGLTVCPNSSYDRYTLINMTPNLGQLARTHYITVEVIRNGYPNGASCASGEPQTGKSKSIRETRFSKLAALSAHFARARLFHRFQVHPHVRRSDRVQGF